MLPVWAAVLIVGAVLLGIAGVLGLLSKRQVEQTSPVPQQTVESVKQDINEVKEARHDRA